MKIHRIYTEYIEKLYLILDIFIFQRLGSIRMPLS